MFGWAILFLIIAIIAGMLGFGGVAGAAFAAAKIVFIVALIALVITAVMGYTRRGLKRAWRCVAAQAAARALRSKNSA